MFHVAHMEVKEHLCVHIYMCVSRCTCGSHGTTVCMCTCVCHGPHVEVMRQLCVCHGAHVW